ncbi:extracellular exonuclease ExeM [Shewanella surugensis]|uniref:Extracellular exonuclease ExeM n=1 Tax=Shewanella surugensis TaxID=212020 RepID=A0ABT0L941_9GAMM|nr:extracellular exonuclease ExeM [Shewanella surugensis]MCL1124074.1 extracellular exonuclease ExeM [Shewanella surugensis]
MMYKTKLTIASLAVASMLPNLAQADIVISEYVEGSSFNKAIELYNTSDSSVDLTGYSIVRYKDGSTDATDAISLDGQQIAAGGIKVLAHGSASLGLEADVDVMTASFSFNGGDAVALLNGDTVIDVVGSVPTASSWGKDVTLQRNQDALSASAAFIENQWTTLAKDTFSGLGAIADVVDPDAPVEEPFTCEGEILTPIYTVQGAGESSPLIAEGTYASAEEVTIKGVVTARGENLFKGFYLQDIEGDGLAETSDGIFVYLNEAAPDTVQPGVEVCVQGLVKEYYNLTQIDIKDDKKMEVGEQGEMLAASAFYVSEGENLATALERFEGMNVKLELASVMKVTRNFSFDYDAFRNNMVLSHKAPLMKPTQVYPALSEAAIALADANSENQLIIESDFKADDGAVPYFTDFNAETGYIRIGDQLVNLEGVISYSYDQYRLIATNTLIESDFIHLDDRLDSPTVATQGDIRVASFNVLNYFTDAIAGDANPTGSNRGAETEAEMILQRTKIVNAIVAMNADIVGLMEIENNGYGENSAIQNLLTALNGEFDEEAAYQFIEINDVDKYEGKYIGSDAIAVGLLYRPSTVTLSGDAFVIETPEQHAAEGLVTRGEGDSAEPNPAYDKYQRHSLGQTFTINDERLTVVVNHLKSKGSACLEDWLAGEENDDPADLQGRCNAFRVSAATVIGDALATVEGDILVIGDMNAYGLEDPIRVLTDFDATTSTADIYTASNTTLSGEVFDTEGRKIEQGYGFINLNTQAHGAATYSYSYSGELGNLDHALGNASVAERMVAIEDWHINSVESTMFEYSSEYTGDLTKSENAFSASDHDPVIVALSYPEPEEETPTPSIIEQIIERIIQFLSRWGFWR